MAETFTVLVAEGDDGLRDELVGQLPADGYQAIRPRTAAQARCRAGHGPVDPTPPYVASKPRLAVSCPSRVGTLG
jgi:hypothetical protein